MITPSFRSATSEREDRAAHRPAARRPIGPRAQVGEDQRRQIDDERHDPQERHRGDVGRDVGRDADQQRRRDRRPAGSSPGDRRRDAGAGSCDAGHRLEHVRALARDDDRRPPTVTGHEQPRSRSTTSAPDRAGRGSARPASGRRRGRCRLPAFDAANSRYGSAATGQCREPALGRRARARQRRGTAARPSRRGRGRATTQSARPRAAGRRPARRAAPTSRTPSATDDERRPGATRAAEARAARRHVRPRVPGEQGRLEEHEGGRPDGARPAVRRQQRRARPAVRRGRRAPPRGMRRRRRARSPARETVGAIPRSPPRASPS